VLSQANEGTATRTVWGECHVLWSGVCGAPAGAKEWASEGPPPGQGNVPPPIPWFQPVGKAERLGGAVAGATTSRNEAVGSKAPTAVVRGRTFNEHGSKRKRTNYQRTFNTPSNEPLERGPASKRTCSTWWKWCDYGVHRLRRETFIPTTAVYLRTNVLFHLVAAFWRFRFNVRSTVPTVPTQPGVHHRAWVGETWWGLHRMQVGTTAPRKMVTVQVNNTTSGKVVCRECEPATTQRSSNNAKRLTNKQTSRSAPVWGGGRSAGVNVVRRSPGIIACLGSAGRTARSVAHHRRRMARTHVNVRSVPEAPCGLKGIAHPPGAGEECNKQRSSHSPGTVRGLKARW